MKKFFKMFILFVIACVILVWLGAVINCEVLTFMHGEQFKNLCMQTNMLGEEQYLKVLKYTGEVAEVYYVSENRTGGDLIKFIKEDGEWKYVKWKTIWSRSGSADGFIWPYIR